MVSSFWRCHNETGKTLYRNLFSGNCRCYPDTCRPRNRSQLYSVQQRLRRRDNRSSWQGRQTCYYSSSPARTLMQWYELRRKNKIRHKQSVFDNTNGDYESHSPRLAYFSLFFISLICLEIVLCNCCFSNR